MVHTSSLANAVASVLYNLTMSQALSVDCEDPSALQVGVHSPLSAGEESSSSAMVFANQCRKLFCLLALACGVVAGYLITGLIMAATVFVFIYLTMRVGYWEFMLFVGCINFLITTGGMGRAMLEKPARGKGAGRRGARDLL